MEFDIEGARAAGYSDGEIADFLGKDTGFDVAGAQKAGYQPAEIVAHLSTLKKPRGLINTPARATDAEIDSTLNTPINSDVVNEAPAGTVLERMQFPEPKFDPAEGERLSSRKNAEASQPGRARQTAAPIVGKTIPVNTKGTLTTAASLVGSQVDSYAAGVGYKAGDVAEALGATKAAENLKGRASAVQGRADRTNQSISLSADGAFEKYAPQILAVFPTMAVAAASGGLPVMFGIAEVQSYAESRKAGLSPLAALGRAVPMGAAEVIGEKLGGTGKLLEALEKAAVKGGSIESLKELSGRMAAAGMREVPSEEATYAMQFGIDKTPGIGLNQKAGVDDFLEGVKDTAIVAAGAGGMMAGGSMALNRLAARQKAFDEKYPAQPGTPPGVPPTPVDPVAAIAKATNVDEAIAAAQAAIQSSTAVDNIAEILKQNQPAAVANIAEAAIENVAGLSPEIAALTRGINELEGADVSPTATAPTAEAAAPAALDEIPAGAAAGNEVQPAAPGALLDPVRAEPGAGALDPRLIPVSQRTSPIAENVQDQTATGAPAQGQAAPAQTSEAGARPGVQPAAAGTPAGDAAVQAAGIDGKQVYQIGGRDPSTRTYEHRADGRVTRTIEYPDGQSSTETLVTDKQGDEHWVSTTQYQKGEYFPAQLSQEKAEAAIRDDLSGTSATPKIAPATAPVAPQPTARQIAIQAEKAKIEAGKAAPKPIDPRLVPKSLRDSDPEHIGKDNTPLVEGGKPFKTNREAKLAQKQQPMMRVVKAGKGKAAGYALAPKTEKQIAAQEKAARRLGGGYTSPAGEAISAHSFIADKGGLAPEARADMGMDGNQRIGSRWLFAGAGRGLTIERATEYLVEEGYLPEGASHSQAMALIKRSLTQPQYTPEGTERMAQAEAETQFEDHLAAQQEAAAEDPDFDPFPAGDGWLEADLQEAGYDVASPEIQAEVRALIDMADAAGIDSESLMLDAHDATRNGTTQEYYEEAKSALEKAIAGSDENSSDDAGQPSRAPEQEPAGPAAAASDPAADEGLTDYTPKEVLDRLAKLEQAEKDRQAADTKADAEAKKERERKDIASRQDASAENFELGQDADDSLSGQQGMFSRAKPAAIKDQTDTPAFKKWFGSSKVADAKGKPLRVFHGTTADFSVFSRDRANPESDMGAGFYFSNTPADVAANYAGEGPDLTAKIERRAEAIEGESDGDIDMDAAREQARKEFSEHAGATMPVYLAIQNPVVIGGKDETAFVYEQPYDEDTDEYGEETGSLVDVLMALQGMNYDGMDYGKITEDLSDAMAEGEIGASELIEKLKGSEGLQYATDDNGNLFSTEIIRQAFEEAGFDGVIDNTVNSKFGSDRATGQKMKGMQKGAVHYIAFQPEQIKSATGNNGDFDASNPDVRRSQGTAPSASTAAAVRTALAAHFGPLTTNMEKRGFLKVWDSAQQFNESGQSSIHVEGTAQGLWDGKTAHLFADGIQQGDEVAVMLHEVGEHASMQKMLGTQQYNRLVARAHDLMYADDPVALEAVARIPDNTPEKFRDSELLAYMIEIVASQEAKATPTARKWLADVVAAIRAWWFQTPMAKKLLDYGIRMELTPKDIAALAVRAVKWQGRQQGEASAVLAPAFSRKLDGQTNEDMPPKPLTESKFFSQYMQHIARAGTDVESIQRSGFHPGIGPNLLPPYRGGEPTNAMDAKYHPKAGDTVLLVPKAGWRDTPNGRKIVDGWKPAPHEVVTVAADKPDMYQEYLRAFDESNQPATQSGRAQAATKTIANETPAFKKWFGDSKVVDDAGKPLVVYHGMSGQFEGDKFGEGESIPGAIFFTDSQTEASWYATGGSGNVEGRGENVMPVYLAIQNPHKIYLKGALDYESGRIPEAIEAAKRRGQDGLIVYGAWNGNEATGEPGMANETQYVAFDPEQIKSAIGNNGAFAGGNPDIRYSRTATQTGTPATQPNLNPWRDETGRLQFAPGAWLYDRIGNAASPLLVKLSMKAATPELRRQLRQMKIDVEKAQETAVAIARETTKLTEDERAMVSDLVEQELKVGVIPPAHAVKLAAMINDAMGRQTDELVSLGMLTKDSADKWRGKYLPRYYESKLKDKLVKAGATWAEALMGLTGRQSVMKGIKGKNLKGRGLYETIAETDLANYEALGWEVRDPDFQPGLPTMDGTVQVWRDFRPAEREKMGEIRDAGFRFVMGYMQTQRDIALGKMFERMAQDPDSSSRLEKEGYVQVPVTVVSGTGAKVYGKLAGRWVPRETMSQLSNIEESTSAAWQMYRKAMGVWKMGKTAMNPVAHVNNVVSNLTMAHLAGVSYLRGDKYIAAARDFVKKTPMLQEAKDNGLFLGTLSDTELMNSMPEELRILAQKQESTTLKVARTGFDILTMFLRKPMGAAYQAEDTFFRYLIYKDARERGTEPQDAVDYAQRYIFTYDDLPKGARRVRDFGIPFFSYTYKAAPALLHTLLTHPVRMAAPAAVLWGINAAAYAIATGDDDDDWTESLQKYLNDPAHRARAREKEKLEREYLPPWNKGTTALMTPKMIRLGMDEVTKLPLFIDVSRIIPGGDMFDVSPNAGGIPLPQPITPSHPLFTTAVAMLGNKDLFRGKDLVDKNDTKGEAAEKRAEWLWTQLAPAVAAGSYHWERGMNALAQATGKELTWMPDVLGGDATGIGKDGLPVQPKYAAMQTFGIKVRPLDLDTSAAIDKNMQRKLMRDIDTEMSALRRLESKGAISPRAVDKARELADMKKDRIRQGLTVDGNERD